MSYKGVSLGYNIAELPVTDLGHTLRVIRIGRAVDSHLRDVRNRLNAYMRKERMKKAGLL